VVELVFGERLDDGGPVAQREQLVRDDAAGEVRLVGKPLGCHQRLDRLDACIGGEVTVFETPPLTNGSTAATMARCAAGDSNRGPLRSGTPSPRRATVRRPVFVDAWRMALKLIATFRDDSKLQQPLGGPTA